MSEDKFIRKLSVIEFGEGFAKHFPTGDVSFAPVEGFPRFLTTSEDLQRNSLLTAMASGAQFGMTFRIYRYDEKDKLRGNPLNCDEYFINNNLELFKRQPPKLEHRISLDDFSKKLKLWFSGVNHI